MKQDQKMIRDKFWQRVLCTFSYATPKFYADSLFGYDPRVMERLGIFVCDTPATEVYCPRCGEITSVELSYNKSGESKFWRVCCSPVKPISPLSLRIWQVNAEPMIEQFRSCVGIKGSIVKIAPDNVWKFGRCGQQTFIYVKRVIEDNLSLLNNMLREFPNAIIVTPRLCYLEELNIVAQNRGIAWDDVSYLDDVGKIQFDMQKIESIIEPERMNPHKQSRRRAPRSTNIECLTAILKEHYRMSKDHYYNTDCQLLPRPTQAELARKIGSRQDVVSRCLNDSEATMLKFLWDNAENPDVILSGRHSS
jgi:hypothetical protein